MEEKKSNGKAKRAWMKKRKMNESHGSREIKFKIEDEWDDTQEIQQDVQAQKAHPFR